jgi:3D (Asp-Asp-Asp) domain-containing protein
MPVLAIASLPFVILGAATPSAIASPAPHHDARPVLHRRVAISAPGRQNALSIGATSLAAAFGHFPAVNAVSDAGPPVPTPAPPPPPPPAPAPTAVKEERVPHHPAVAHNDLGDFVVTCYDLHGHTASGAATTEATVAVDPAVIPLGSRIYIGGVGERIAEDTGGAIVGNRLDIWEPTYSDCMDWGVRDEEVIRLG